MGPETALKLTINDEVKNYLESLPWTGVKKADGKSSLNFGQRVLLGGISGGIAQASGEKKQKKKKTEEDYGKLV